jgi:uncharacterized membrane protein
MTVVAEKSSTGLEVNLAAALSYAFWWVTGVIFLVLEKESRFVRFHAMQSTLAFGSIWLLGFVISWVLPIIGWMLSFFIWVAGIVLWIICIIKAFQGERYKLPFFGDLAEKQVGPAV